jgi:hypothetical protein
VGKCLDLDCAQGISSVGEGASAQMLKEGNVEGLLCGSTRLNNAVEVAGLLCYYIGN